METHNREREWWRWAGSLDDLHDLAWTADAATGEHFRGDADTRARVRLIDREVEFLSADQFVSGFGVEELRKLKDLTIDSSDMTTTQPVVRAYIQVAGPGYAATLAVDGTSRAAVDAVLAHLEERMERGRRRLNVPIRKLHRSVAAIGALGTFLASVGVMALAGVFSSDWWIIALCAAGAVALAAIGGLLTRTVARRIAPWLELLPPGQQTAWQRFRNGSLRNGERLLWLAIGAGLAIIVNLLS
jgi:hypothetical protein